MAGGNEVMLQRTFDRLLMVDGRTKPGPWSAACLSDYTGPTWVFFDEDGNVVPLTAVVIAWAEGETDGPG